MSTRYKTSQRDMNRTGKDQYYVYSWNQQQVPGERKWSTARGSSWTGLLPAARRQSLQLSELGAGCAAAARWARRARGLPRGGAEAQRQPPVRRGAGRGDFAPQPAGRG